MAIARDVQKVFDAAVASANVEVTDARSFKRFQLEGSATGGTWTVQLESSRDEGATWVPVSGVTTLASASDSVFLTGQFDRLRVKGTRTGGTLNAWVTRSDSHPMRW